MTEQNSQAYTFWNSISAADFPYAITVGEVRTPLHDLESVYPLIFSYLQYRGLLGDDEHIVDVCGGASSHLYLGHWIDQTVVADFSQVLLMRSMAPQERQMAMDIGVDEFPNEMGNSATLVTMIFGTRYLSQDEKLHAYEQVKNVLSPGGFFVLIDTVCTSAEFEKTLGQIMPFYPGDEARILEHVGFRVMGIEPLRDEYESHLYDDISIIVCTKSTDCI